MDEDGGRGGGRGGEVAGTSGKGNRGLPSAPYSSKAIFDSMNEQGRTERGNCLLGDKSMCVWKAGTGGLAKGMGEGTLFMPTNKEAPRGSLKIFSSGSSSESFLTDKMQGWVAPGSGKVGVKVKSLPGVRGMPVAIPGDCDG